MRADQTGKFEDSVNRWGLVPDGPPLHTCSSDLLPVRYRGEAAMLKLARNAEERQGHGLMVWWAGEGAARVLHHGGNALLMERVEGNLSLTRMVEDGQDDGASRVLCEVVHRLHASRPHPRPELTPLGRWFRALEQLAPGHGGVLTLALETARRLLAQPHDVIPLHGDIHHGNVLHGARGWLAIDPKGLLGERTYDHANILCNPDLEVATRPGRLARQSSVVADAAGLDRTRLLEWVLAYAGLSASWHLEDGAPERAEAVLGVARIAAGELGV